MTDRASRPPLLDLPPLLEAVVDRHHPDADLRLELLVLRHELGVVQRQVKGNLAAVRRDLEDAAAALRSEVRQHRADELERLRLHT